MESITINGKEYQLDVDKCKEQGLLKEQKIDIFEGAKFGDKFLTKDGRRVAYVPLGHAHYCLLESHLEALPYSPDGHCIACWVGARDLCDIVGRYIKPVDEEKLDKLANYYMLNPDTVYAYDIKLQMEAFKAGYRKAMEE